MPQKSTPAAKPSTSPAARIALIYLAVNCGWILLSDWVSFSVVRDIPLLCRISVLKGCLSVGGSALFLYLLIGRHFSHQERARQRATASEARYRTLFELSGVGVALVDHSSDRFLEVNGKFCEIVGYRGEELVGRTFREITHPDDLPHDLKSVEQLKRGEIRAFTREKRYCTADGQVVQARLTVSRMWLDDEEPTATIAVIQDITAAKEAEAALHDANQRLEERVSERTAELKRAERSIAELNDQLQRQVEEMQLLLDTSPIGLAITRDPLAATIRGNVTLERLLGAEAGCELSLAAAAPPYRVCRAGRQLAVSELPMQRAARGESVQGESLEIVRGDGTVVHVYAYASPLRDAGGGATGAVGAFMDITQRKRGEEELRLHRDHLDSLVKERTAELATRNAELAEQIEERREAQRAKAATITLLRLCNEAPTALKLVEELVTFFRTLTGCDAVGVRLRDGEDYPYFLADGLSGPFVQAENSLCGGDAGGEPLLGCLCGTVISGSPLEPVLAPFFTASGTFWTNSAATFAAGLAGCPLRHPVRKRCLEEGYRSIALIPLRLQGEVFGLVQLNGRGEGLFSPEQIALAETLVSYAAIALGKLRTDDALHESARALREAQQIARIGSYRYDFASDRWSSSETVDEIFGIEPGFERSSAGWLRLLHPADRPGVEAHLRGVLERRVSFSREHRIVRGSDGSERWVHVLGEPEYAPDGTPLRLVGTVQDVTQRKNGEQALRASERRFRTLIERAPIAMAICRDATVVYANRKLLDLFGLGTLDEIRGRSVGLLAAPPCRDEVVQRALHRSVGLPVPDEYEAVAVRKGGGDFPVQVAATPVLLADGVATISFFYDISERKKAEEAVRRYTRRLIELEEELRKRIATELHDDIGQELTALGLNLSFISSALTDACADLRVRLEDSRLIARGIGRTVRSMMTELRPPQLDELGLASALRSHAETFGSRTGIEVAVQAAEELPPLSVRTETALFRIAQEALTNVAKHAEASRAALSLVPQGERVLLTVTDNGRGFVPGDTAPGPGCGWGLTLMRERAALIGGSFQVHSSPGTGTRIAIAVREEV